MVQEPTALCRFLCLQGALRPITCCSPTLPNDPSDLMAHNSCHSVATQQAQAACLHRPIGGQSLPPKLPATKSQEATASRNCGGLVPVAEESSWLLPESSKLSAAGGALQAEHSSCQRRTALPAANRAMLERQVRDRLAAVHTVAAPETPTAGRHHGGCTVDMCSGSAPVTLYTVQ